LLHARTRAHHQYGSYGKSVPATGDGCNRGRVSAALVDDDTDCRHQLKDGIEKTGKHTVEIMYDSLAKKTFKS
jgi:hypothetical protein